MMRMHCNLLSLPERHGRLRGEQAHRRRASSPGRSGSKPTRGGQATAVQRSLHIYSSRRCTPGAIESKNTKITTRDGRTTRTAGTVGRAKDKRARTIVGRDRRSRKDSKDGRDSKDNKDIRDQKDQRDPKDSMHNRDSKDRGAVRAPI